MKPSRLTAKMAFGRWLVWSSAVVVGFIPGVSITLSAQSPPPVQGTIALEGTMKVTEGVGTRIDPGRKQVTIGFDDGKAWTLALTDRAAAEAGKAAAGTPKVIIYYSDDAGQKVAHFFKSAVSLAQTTSKPIVATAQRRRR